MSDTPRYARVPATMGRESHRRDARHTAAAGTLRGIGTSQTAALDDLGRQLLLAAERDAGEPSFWWDAANRLLWVAVPDVMHGGYRAYLVHMEGDAPKLSYGVSSGVADARDAFVNSVGMTRVTR